MRKLFILFSALWLLAWCGTAAAASSGYQWKYSSTVRGSAQAACDYFASLYGGGTAYQGVLSNPQPSSGTAETFYSYDCAATAKSNGYVVARSTVSRGSLVNCSGSTPEFSTTSGQCEAPPGPKCDTPKGQPVSWTQVDTGYPKTSPKCGLTDLPAVTDCWKKGETFYCSYEGTSTGENAPAGTPEGSGVGREPTDAQGTTSTPADSKGGCPRGTVAAGIDSAGTQICMGTGTNPGGKTTSTPTSTTTKGTDAAGNSTETTTTTQQNSDGSTSTTTVTTTTAPDGSKTVTGSTTTGTTAGGLQGEKDPQESDFCKQHPELNACRNSSVSGSCGTVACTGDAIQCATLRAAAAMQCAQDADKKALEASAQKTLGDAILGGNDPQKGAIEAAIKGTEIDLSKPQLDQTGFLGGGSCLANKTMTVMGKTVTVDFTRICSDIQPLRAVIMAVAFIAAYMIVSRSVLSA